MANDIKQVTNVNGGKFNLGDIEKAAIRGVEQGKNAIELLYGGVQRETGDEAFTIKEDINFLIFAGNVTSSRIITLPVARAAVCVPIQAEPYPALFKLLTSVQLEPSQVSVSTLYVG